MNKLLAILALGALVAPVALAHGDSSQAGAAGLYVGNDNGVWQESNGDDGLQQAAHCHLNHVHWDDSNNNGVVDPGEESDHCHDSRDADSKLL